MEILSGIWTMGLGLYIKPHKTLVIGDLHMGYEEAMNRQGVFVPRVSTKEIMQAIEEAMNKTKPETVVFLGDLKHEFGRISDQEWRDVLKILDFVSQRAKKTVILKGNHDKMLDAITHKRRLEVTERLVLGDFFFCHGDALFDKHPDFKAAKTVIIGHEHPAIGVRDGARLEKFKCFLLGKYGKKNLIVLPSFNPINEGTDVTQERLLSPFIKNVDDFEAFIVADKTYDFGKIKKLRKLRM
jgi:uncharacterized protein